MIRISRMICTSRTSADVTSTTITPAQIPTAMMKTLSRYPFARQRHRDAMQPSHEPFDLVGREFERDHQTNLKRFAKLATWHAAIIDGQINRRLFANRRYKGEKYWIGR